MPTPIEQEARDTYARFVALRDEIDAGASRGRRSPTSSPRTRSTSIRPGAASRGARTIREFFEKSMAGLTGHGWSTPENWTMGEGARLVSQWDQILGTQAGRHALAGRRGSRSSTTPATACFCYSHDMLNMTHIGQTMKAMGWKPPRTFNMPPREPNRDISLPTAWAHLEKSRAR